MNSFQRMENLLLHKKTDKTPFYFPAISCTVASEILGREVHAGGDSLHYKEESILLDGDTAHREFVEEHHLTTIELNRILKADLIRETWRSSERPSKRIDEHTLKFEYPDGNYKLKRFFPANQSYGIIEDSQKGLTPEKLKIKLIQEMAGNSMQIEPDVMFRDQLRLKTMAKPYFPVMFNAACPFIKIDDPVWLMASVLETDLLAEYLIYKTENYLKHLDWAATNEFKIILGGSDTASNDGPIISPDIYKRLMSEPLKMISDKCREKNMIYCYRSDGKMWNLMDIIFKNNRIGIFGEADRNAGMTVGAVKEKFSDLIILGNISSAVLHKENDEKVRIHTREGLAESNGINYIAGPSNLIVHGTPVENVWAMVDEISRYDSFAVYT